ncbi:hypothetical protein ACC28_07920 [Francisella tularensis subsp. holarctica]|nr:hypothetical protein ACC28_07920 [Francisella tularensis subsp. holarctica]
MLAKFNKFKGLFIRRNSYNNSYISELISSIHRTDIKANYTFDNMGSWTSYNNRYNFRLLS